MSPFLAEVMALHEKKIELWDPLCDLQSEEEEIEEENEED